MYGFRRGSWAAAALALAACSGAGPDDGDGDGDDTAAPAVEELYSARGWMQRLDDASGAWIEEESAALPTSCDGDLGAVAGAPGLAHARRGPGGSGERFASWDDLGPWPDAEAAPTVMGRVSVRGDLIDAESEGYPRTLALLSQGLDDLVYLDVCETAAARGACHVPGPSFPFQGCIGTAGQRVGFVLVDFELVESDGALRADTSYGHTCNNSNQRLDGHPEDVAFGDQQLLIAAEASDLPEGERVALNPAQVTWSGSIKVEEDCETVEDLGEVCDCAWGWRGRVDLAEAWALRQGDQLHLLLRGSGADADFFLWGTYGLR